MQKNRQERRVTRLEEIGFSNAVIDEVLAMEKNKGQAILGNTELVCERVREIRDDLVYVSKVLTALRKKAREFHKESQSTDAPPPLTETPGQALSGNPSEPQSQEPVEDASSRPPEEGQAGQEEGNDIDEHKEPA